MCGLCVYAEHAPNAMVNGAVACTVGGELARYCPRGVFAPNRKTMKWAGVEWIGVPIFHRILLRLFHPKKPAFSVWAGCGCLSRLRDWWDKATA